jgi:sugar phosphate isomerase/epimerase
MRKVMPTSSVAVGAALLVLAGALTAAQAPAGLPISAQLYTVRNVGGLDEQLATVASAGIKYVEPFRFAGMKEVPAAEFKALLDKHGLKVSGMHVNIGALIEETDRIAEYNTTIGNTRLIVPALPASITPRDKAGWQAIGRLFGTLAATFKPKGMQVGFHNHAVEMEVFDGKTGYEWFAEAAGPDVIFTLDVAWAARGKQDPAALLGRMKGRVWNIHAKDNAPEGTATDERGFSILGKGTVDWNAVLPAAKDAGVLFYTLEHDMPKDAAVVLKEGNAYLSGRLEKLLAR